MGSILFQCDCGHSFLNSTDSRSYAAYVLPDQAYDAFSEVVDRAIEASGPTEIDKSSTCMAWRTNVPLVSAFQCPNCGDVWIEDQHRQRHRFVPASAETSKRVFRRR